MSTANIAKALVAAQSEMGAASKDAKNPFFKSKYADLNSIREAVIPPLNKHGVVVLQPIVTRDGIAYVHTILLHESGENIVSEIPVNPGKNEQERGSSISYCRRYALQSMLCVGAEDDDGESTVGRPAAKKVVEKKDIGPIMTKIKQVAGVLLAKGAIDTDKLISILEEEYGVNKKEDLTAEQAEDFLSKLEKLGG